MMPDFYGDVYAPVTWERPADHDYRDISYETSPEGIAKITICRPEVRNAFRPQTLFELPTPSTGPRRRPTSASSSSPARAPRPSARAATSASGATTATSATTTARASAGSTCSTSRSRSAAAEAGRRDGRRLGHRRRARAARRVRPHDRRRQRPLRPDRPEGGQLRRRVRLGAAGPHRRPEEGARDLVPVPSSTTPRRRSTWAS